MENLVPEGNFLVSESPSMELRFVRRGENRVLQQKFLAQKFMRPEGAQTQAELQKLELKGTEIRWKDIPYAGPEERLLK